MTVEIFDDRTLARRSFEHLATCTRNRGENLIQLTDDEAETYAARCACAGSKRINFEDAIADARRVMLGTAV